MGKRRFDSLGNPVPGSGSPSNTIPEDENRFRPNQTMDAALPVPKGDGESHQVRPFVGSAGLEIEDRIEGPFFFQIENLVFIRLLITLALLLAGSYLIAIAVTGISLLPLTVVAFAASGMQTIPCGGITPFCNTATLQQLVGIFISELMLGLVFAIGSVFTAFFKFGLIRATHFTPR